MPFFENHQPGMFCWVELGTSDQSAAKRFYQDLFGWTVRDTPIGEGMVYTIFQYKDRDVAACYTLMPDQVAAQVPPHWMNYIAVTSADETADKVKSLGGNVLSPPMDVFEHGRMVVFTDPTGAVVSAWQPRQHKGFGYANEPGGWCWAELMTPDPARAKTFYTSLFGYTTDTMPMATNQNATYTIFKIGEQGVGGMMPMPPEAKGVPPNWTPYFAVADCDDIFKKATSTGAAGHMPPTDIPTVGRFAILQDPQGAAFAILQPVPVTA
jgi:uncharacterized protein